jgi:pectinesterase
MKRKNYLIVALTALMLAGCGTTVSSSNVAASSAIATSEPSTAEVSSSAETPSSSEAPSSSEVVSSAVSSSEVSSEAVSSAASSSEVSYEASSSEELSTLVSKIDFYDYLTNSAVVAGGAFTSSIFSCNASAGVVTGNSYDLDGTTVTKSGKIKIGKSNTIDIAASSAGTLRAVAMIGGSGTRPIAVTDDSGTVISSYDTSKTITTYTTEITAAGTYHITAPGNTIHIFYIDFTQKVKLGTETGLEIDTDNVKKDYLIGDSLNSEGLKVYAVYSSGIKLPLTAADYTLDAAAYKSDTAGTYAVKVSYKTYEAKEFSVKVHAIKSLSLAYKVIQSSSGCKADQVYRFPEVYAIGAALDTSKIITFAICDDDTKLVVPTGTEAGKAILTAPSTATAGATSLNVSVTRGGVENKAEIVIAVFDTTKLVANAGTYTVAVNPAVDDGTVSGTGIMQFKTIQKAHDALKSANLDTTTKKVIEIPAGTYEEKPYIEIPNVTLKGAGLDQTFVKFNAFAASNDDGGLAWSTYGSSTLSVNKNATGFSATGIDFINSAYATAKEYYTNKAASQQACAAVVDADQSYFTLCRFEGFQDTLYARTGRQYYTQCTIEGFTDFIFGEDADAIFTDSTIVVRQRYYEKETDKAKNGYIVATKGVSNIKIGFVFKGCTITAETGTLDGSMALARPWDKYSKVSFLNCVMPAAISKVGYPATNGEARWEVMSSTITPTTAGVAFVEYNNTGDGAITTAVAGGTIIAEDAYTTFIQTIKADTFFGTYIS